MASRFELATAGGTDVISVSEMSSVHFCPRLLHPFNFNVFLSVQVFTYKLQMIYYRHYAWQSKIYKRFTQTISTPILVQTLTTTYPRNHCASALSVSVSSSVAIKYFIGGFWVFLFVDFYFFLFYFLYEEEVKYLLKVNKQKSLFANVGLCRKSNARMRRPYVIGATTFGEKN